MPVPSMSGVMASSHGRILLPDYETPMPKGGSRVICYKPTHGTQVRSKKGKSYIRMQCYSRRWGNIKVHRVVCEAFHGPAPSPSSIVMHINEDATDNRPENLKWGTQKENLNAPGFIAYCRSRTGANSPAIKGRKV